MANLQRLLRLSVSFVVNPARLVEDAVGAVRRTTIFIVCTLVAGFVLLPAVGCAAAGLWIYVQHQLGLVWAAFITAAAFLVLAAIILLIGSIASKRPMSERARNEPARQIEAIAARAPAALSALAKPKRVAAAGHDFFNRYKGTALLTAAVIGLVMGQDVFRPSVRRKR